MRWSAEDTGTCVGAGPRSGGESVNGGGVEVENTTVSREKIIVVPDGTAETIDCTFVLAPASWLLRFSPAVFSSLGTGTGKSTIDAELGLFWAFMSDDKAN